MKIGILGAPGAGKTKLAKALGKEYGLKVVDNYVQRLQRDTDLALGPWATYSEHLMVAGLREAAIWKAGDAYVTAGTILDSVTYAMVKTDVTMHQSAEAARHAYLDAEAAVKGLTLMYKEMWGYALAFYLPYDDETKREKAGTWEAALDSAYAAVIESYQAPFTYTLAPSADRIELAKEVIDIARAPDAEGESPQEAEAPSPTE